MEQTEHPDLKEEKQLDAEVLKASEEISYPSQQFQFSCSSCCSFSKQEYDILNSAERSKSTRKLCGLIIFYVVAMVIEVIGGLKANSLAVLTDAAHLLTDIAGFSIALFTVWVSGWEATPQQSFGYSRLEVLGALLSVQLIWFISGFLIYEAIDRILHKDTNVNGKLMFIVAAFGFIINFVMVVWLGHDHSHHSHSHHHACTNEEHDHEMQELCQKSQEESTHLESTISKKAGTLNINIQGAYLHVIVDLIQSIGVMIAGSIIWLKPGWLFVDLLCTLIFSIFSLSTTIPMLKSIFCILMERTPSEIDIAHLESGVRRIKGLHDVHDLHVWSITAGKYVMACHVVTEREVDSNEILKNVREYCEQTFRIQHVTVQIEQML